MFDAYEGFNAAPARPRVEYSGVFRRLVAVIIDSFLLAIYSYYMKDGGGVNAVIKYFTGTHGGFLASLDMSTLMLLMAMFICYMPMLIFYIIPTWLFGGSFGKIMTGLIVVNEYHEPVGLGRSFLRCFCYSPILFILPFFLQSALSSIANGQSVANLITTMRILGVLAAAMPVISIFTVIFNSQNRAVHDMLAGTMVVLKKTIFVKKKQSKAEKKKDKQRAKKRRSDDW